LTEQQQTRAWVEQSAEARELIFQALCTSFGSDLANLIIGIEASGNPRPLAGLSLDQLQSINRQLEQMGVELRYTLEPEAQVAFEVSLDAAQQIVTEEMREKTLPASSAWSQAVTI
jgi:hypothetical protein